MRINNMTQKWQNVSKWQIIFVVIVLEKQTNKQTLKNFFQKIPGNESYLRRKLKQT